MDKIEVENNNPIRRHDDIDEEYDESDDDV